jgi:hypothetical protein
MEIFSGMKKIDNAVSVRVECFGNIGSPALHMFRVMDSSMRRTLFIFLLAWAE